MAVELSLRNVFQDFNHSKFVVYSSLFLFSILFALKEDQTLNCPYWATFIPLWIWKILALTGGIVGCVIHRKHPPNRNDFAAHAEYCSMILSFGEHLLLLMFELLVCYKLDAGGNILWLFVFIPLFFESVLSILVCIWSLRREKSFEFELFFSVNVLQFVFLALKLDLFINWPWVIIFVPLWILLCLSLIGVLYAIVLAVLLIRSIDLLPEHRRQHVYTAIGYTFLVVPILIFLVLLTNKLDEESQLSYLMVCTPLYVSLICLILMACGTKGGNQLLFFGILQVFILPYFGKYINKTLNNTEISVIFSVGTGWFGIRRDFCQFLLDACPCLREYGNVSYRFSGSHDSPDTNDSPDSSERQNEKRAVLANVHKELRPVMPNVSIDCPD